MSQTQYDYRYSITVVEFNCKASTQGATSRYTSHLTSAVAAKRMKSTSQPYLNNYDNYNKGKL